MFKIFTGSAPKYLIDYFTCLYNVHSYNTRRNSHNYFMPSVNNNMLLNSFHLQGVKDWNMLLINIKSSQSIDNFKKSVKQYLFVLAANENVSDFIFY